MLNTIGEWIDPDQKAFWNFEFSLWNSAGLFLSALLLFLRSNPIREAFWFLDGVDLIIHEAGHPLFGAFGISFVGFLGGTLMQLIMPIAFYVYFLRHTQPKSADICLFWIGQNFLNVGRYMADARAQEMPLLGGEHDWAYMLDEVGLLRFDTVLGHLMDFLGCTLIAFSIYGLYVHFRERRRTNP